MWHTWCFLMYVISYQLDGARCDVVSLGGTIIIKRVTHRICVLGFAVLLVRTFYRGPEHGLPYFWVGIKYVLILCSKAIKIILSLSSAWVLCFVLTKSTTKTSRGEENDFNIFKVSFKYLDSVCITAWPQLLKATYCALGLFSGLWWLVTVETRDMFNG